MRWWFWLPLLYQKELSLWGPIIKMLLITFSSPTPDGSVTNMTTSEVASACGTCLTVASTTAMTSGVRRWITSHPSEPSSRWKGTRNTPAQVRTKPVMLQVPGSSILLGWCHIQEDCYVEWQNVPTKITWIMMLLRRIATLWKLSCLSEPGSAVRRWRSRMTFRTWWAAIASTE